MSMVDRRRCASAHPIRLAPGDDRAVRPTQAYHARTYYFPAREVNTSDDLGDKPVIN